MFVCLCLCVCGWVICQLSAPRQWPQVSSPRLPKHRRHPFPPRHHIPPRRALDLVACGSHKPRAFFGPATISTREEVTAASVQFVATWVARRGLAYEDLGPSASAAGCGNRHGAVVVPVPRGRRGRGPGRSGASGSGGGFSSGRPSASSGSSNSSGGRELRGFEGRVASGSWWASFKCSYWRELVMITRNPVRPACRTCTPGCACMHACSCGDRGPAAGPDYMRTSLD